MIYDVMIVSESVDTELMNKIKLLFTTPKGSIPYDRDYGIDFSIIDKPISIVKGLLMVSYIDALRRYVSNISIEDIYLEIKDFSIISKVVIKSD